MKDYTHERLVRLERVAKLAKPVVENYMGYTEDIEPLRTALNELNKLDDPPHSRSE